MKLWLIGKVAVGVLLFGALRWPLELGLMDEQRELDLRAEREVSLELQEQLGQQAFAVALGGYRSVVATWFSLLAYDAWDRTAWDELEQRYRIAQALQPQEIEYWRVGGWHMAYNASVDFQYDESLPPQQRRLRWREMVERGRKIYEDGARQNPDAWQLWSELGMLWSDRFKVIDRQKAMEAFRRAWEAPNAPQFLRRFAVYNADATGDAQNRRWALEEIDAMWEDRRNRMPTLLLHRFFLMHEAGREDAPRMEEFVQTFLGATSAASQLAFFESYNDFLTRTQREDSQLGQELERALRARVQEMEELSEQAEAAREDLEDAGPADGVGE